MGRRWVFKLLSEKKEEALRLPTCSRRSGQASTSSARTGEGAALAGGRTAPASEQGFTLLEMLVALAVFSLAALALVRLQGVTLRTAADLDSKALGQIVARNLMVEVQTDAAPPSIGSEEGDVENGGRRWHWVRMVKATSDKRLLQVDLTVSGQAGTSPVVLSFVRAVQ